MNERDTNAIAALQAKFSVKATPTEKGITLEFPGVPDVLTLSTANDEFTVYTKEWHEHFPDIEELKSFLGGLFTGTAKIVVEYRGKSPVAHQRQVLKDGKWIVMSQTGSLVSPFWRPKSYKTIEYKDCQPAGGAYVSPAAGDPSAHP